jgi:hypothetical protein
MGDQRRNRQGLAKAKARREETGPRLKKLPPHDGGGKVSGKVLPQDDQDRSDEAKGGNLILQR